MGLLDTLKGKGAANEEAQAQEEAPKFERVTWYQEPGLRKLYFYAFILCVASATTGYDGYAFLIFHLYLNLNANHVFSACCSIRFKLWKHGRTSLVILREAS